MKIKKLDTEAFKDFMASPDLVSFMRPSGAKLFRVCNVPEVYTRAAQKEISEILTSACRIHKNGIWFFDFSYYELMQMVIRTLCEMGIQAITIEPDESRLN